MKFTPITFETFKTSLDAEFLEMIKDLPDDDYTKMLNTMYHDHWSRARQADFEKLSDYELGLVLKTSDFMLSAGPKIRMLTLGLQGGLGIGIATCVKSKKYQLLLATVTSISLMKIESFALDIITGDTVRQLKNIAMYEFNSRQRNAFYVNVDDAPNPEATLMENIHIHQEHLNKQSPLKS